MINVSNEDLRQTLARVVEEITGFDFTGQEAPDIQMFGDLSFRFGDDDIANKAMIDVREALETLLDGTRADDFLRLGDGRTEGNMYIDVKAIEDASVDIGEQDLESIVMKAAEIGERNAVAEFEEFVNGQGTTSLVDVEISFDEYQVGQQKMTATFDNIDDARKMHATMREAGYNGDLIHDAATGNIEVKFAIEDLGDFRAAVDEQAHKSRQSLDSQGKGRQYVNQPPSFVAKYQANAQGGGTGVPALP